MKNTNLFTVEDEGYRVEQCLIKFGNGYEVIYVANLSALGEGIVHYQVRQTSADRKQHNIKTYLPGELEEAIEYTKTLATGDVR